MAKLRIAPTKSNYLKITKQLAFAKDGYDLLEQKRQILVLELVSRIEAAKRAQADADEKMAAAHEALETAVIRSGSWAMRNEAIASKLDYTVEVTTHSLMGITLPKIEYQSAPLKPQFSLGAGSVSNDAVITTFYDALDAIARLAEVENAVFRLAREVKKTQRRVNALEKVFIPTYNETLKYITATLEEREREGFVIMKMVKERREKLKRQSRPGRTKDEP